MALLLTEGRETRINDLDERASPFHCLSTHRMDSFLRPLSAADRHRLISCAASLIEDSSAKKDAIPRASWPPGVGGGRRGRVRGREVG